MILMYVLDLIQKTVNFFLLYILEDFTFESYTLKSNNRYSDEIHNSKEVLEFFTSDIKNDNTAKDIKIVGQFSKTIPTADIHNTIYIKEAMGMLYALDYFKTEITTSPLCLLCTDFRVSYYLFNSTVQNSQKKKTIRWSLKLILDFPNVRVMNISGKNNISDYLSRLGLSKSTFFSRTLTPLRINKDVTKSLPEILSWENIMDFCEKNPNLIEFSEQKLSKEIIDNYYLDIHLPINPVSMNSLTTLNTQRCALDIFLTRELLIKNQMFENLQDFELKNGLMFFNNLPVLPARLYIFHIMKEHILGPHVGRKSLVNNCRKIFHILNISLLKKLAGQLCDACLSCVLTKFKADTQKHGILKIDKGTIVIQIDLIENLPGKNPFILMVVDIYIVDI